MIARRALLAALPAACSEAREARAATPFALDAAPGPLRPLGGLVLHNGVIGFGGFSGMHLAADLTLTVVSDRARWFSAPLLLRQGRPAALGALRTGALRDARGQPLPGDRDGDAEALVRRPDGGWWLAFEGRHRIVGYTTLDGPGVTVPPPAGLETVPRNGGLETLALLADGRLLAIVERARRGEDAALRSTWLGRPGAWQARAYRPGPGMSPTDAAGLPDGGALVLERRFSVWEGGFTCRIAHVTAAAMSAPVIEGATLLELPPGGPAENYEAIAVLPRDGALWVAVLSDDNDHPLQRSLFLLFRW